MDKKAKEGMAVLLFIFFAMAFARCGWEVGGKLMGN